MKKLWIILGTVVAVVGGLFLVYRFARKPAAPGSASGSAAPAAAVAPQPAGDKTAQQIAAAGGAVAALGGALKGLGIDFGSSEG